MDYESNGGLFLQLVTVNLAVEATSRMHHLQDLLAPIGRVLIRNWRVLEI